jgi:hypothetical protein
MRCPELIELPASPPDIKRLALDRGKQAAAETEDRGMSLAANNEGRYKRVRHLDPVPAYKWLQEENIIRWAREYLTERSSA